MCISIHATHLAVVSLTVTYVRFMHSFQNILDTLEICSKNVSCALKQCMPVSVSYTDTSFSDSIISEASCFAF